jgi:Tfp pilus assembly protein PilF
LGLLYGRKGQIFDAVNELETAVNVNPEHFAAVKNLAILYQKSGFRNKAIETWERALALAPDDATRLSIREHLLRLL